MAPAHPRSGGRSCEEQGELPQESDGSQPKEGSECSTPTSGFSQSSGIPNVWNYWIVYPFLAWVLFTAADGWFVYLRKPISEGEIKREIERQAGHQR